MNNLALTGRLTQDPMWRELPGSDGKHVTDLRLAVKGMGSGSADAVGYVDVVSYTMSERAAGTISKGWLVAVNGRIEHQSWEADGQKRSKHRVVAMNVEFLAAPRADGESNSNDVAAEAEEAGVAF